MTESQKNITSHKEQLDEHSDRIYAMNEHLRNVQQELQHTQVNRNILFVFGFVSLLDSLINFFQLFIKLEILNFHKQDLLNARKREIETENHMKQIGM